MFEENTNRKDYIPGKGKNELCGSSFTTGEGETVGEPSEGGQESLPERTLQERKTGVVKEKW